MWGGFSETTGRANLVASAMPLTCDRISRWHSCKFYSTPSQPPNVETVTISRTFSLSGICSLYSDIPLSDFSPISSYKVLDPPPQEQTLHSPNMLSRALSVNLIERIEPTDISFNCTVSVNCRSTLLYTIKCSNLIVQCGWLWRAQVSLCRVKLPQKLPLWRRKNSKQWKKNLLRPKSSNSRSPALPVCGMGIAFTCTSGSPLELQSEP